MEKDTIVKLPLLPQQIGLVYLGQVGFLIKFRERYILIDGYLSDYVDRFCSNNLVQWVRNYPAPLAPEELDFVDFVFCTHDHADHADPITLSAIARVNPKAKFFVPAPVCDHVAGLGIPADRITGLHPDAPLQLAQGISVTPIPAAHEELHPDANGDFPEMGYIFDLDGTKVFHAGDGCPYDGLEERLNGCEIMIMPINGRDYFRRYEQDIIGNFDSTESILLAKRAGAKLLIPVHFDLYPVNCVNPAYFVDCLQKINPTQPFHIFAPGETYIFVK